MKSLVLFCLHHIGLEKTRITGQKWPTQLIFVVEIWIELQYYYGLVLYLNVRVRLKLHFHKNNLCF